MFTTMSVYFLLLFLIFWSYCGYMILFLLFSTISPRERKHSALPERLPRLAVLVPCYNEEAFVSMKIENIKALDYPEELMDVYFLNGLSTDRTSDAIRELIAGLDRWHLVETGVKGKIHQMNHGLAGLDESAEIIVITDMDAILEADVLKKFVSAFHADEQVAVVGANISPDNCLDLDRSHWEDQNVLRLMESDVYTSTIVVAPCYAFRRFLIDRFPSDCVADDIYTAFKANTEGFITRYVEDARGREIRNPSTLSEFIRHKFRKGNAFLIELLRFLYRLPYMSGWWKTIYLTKFLQVVIVPWAIPYFMLSTISLSMSGWGYLQVALFGLGSLAASFVVTSLMMKRGRGRYLKDAPKGRRALIAPFVISNIILVLVGITYPFYHQNSSYEKVGQKP